MLWKSWVVTCKVQFFINALSAVLMASSSSAPKPTAVSVNTSSSTTHLLHVFMVQLKYYTHFIKVERFRTISVLAFCQRELVFLGLISSTSGWLNSISRVLNTIRALKLKKYHFWRALGVVSLVILNLNWSTSPKVDHLRAPFGEVTRRYSHLKRWSYA